VRAAQLASSVDSRFYQELRNGIAIAMPLALKGRNRPALFVKTNQLRKIFAIERAGALDTSACEVAVTKGLHKVHGAVTGGLCPHSG